MRKLAEVIDGLAGADSPEQQELRALLLERLASRGMMRPPAQLAEAADAKARAAVQRKIRDAAAALAAADGIVADAERAVTATEEPERKASDQALAAAHLLSQVRDDLVAAADAGAEPARPLELRAGSPTRKPSMGMNGTGSRARSSLLPRPGEGSPECAIASARPGRRWQPRRQRSASRCAQTSTRPTAR